MPKADLAIYQQFAYKGEDGGGVSVFVNLSRDNLQQSFNILLGGLGSGANHIDEIGENAAYLSFAGSSILAGALDIIELTFYDCDFVVDFDFIGTTNEISAENYAQRLDKRLNPILCAYQG